MSKQLVFGNEAQAKLLSGAKKVINAVKVTLGPCGRNVCLNEATTMELVVTKDGVTVARGVELEDNFEDMGAKLIKEVSSKSNDDVGDGTTTTCVIADGILDEGVKAVVAGANPILVKRGMDKATDMIVAELKKISKKVSDADDIKNVAAISANNDPSLGNLIAEAIEKVGKDGVITVEESKTMTTTVKVTEGMQFKEGYLSAYFAANDTKSVEYEDAFILLYDKAISSMADLIPILEKVARTGKPLLIIAENVEGEALTTLVINNLRGALKACAVKAPSFGDNRKNILEDIAILTGGTVISEDVGLKLESATLDMLGHAKSVKITKDTTTIVDGLGDKEKLNERIEDLRKQLEDDNGDLVKRMSLSNIKERLAKLSGGVAVIEIGAATETEMKEKRYRIDDTLAATKAALEEGILAGGGSSLIKAANCLNKAVPENEDEKIGFRIIKKAVERPLWQIAENSGVSGDVVVSKVKEMQIDSNDEVFGYDAKNDEYVNMFDAGIIDPTKVTRCALQNATSIAGMLLSSECVIADKPVENKDCQNPNMPLGGM